MTNQWPEFTKTKKTPKTVRRIILEEGSGIAERTGNEISFVVESLPEGKGFVHNCFLWVAKAGYRYPLFRVVQDSLDYPVTVVADVGTQGAPAADEGDLRYQLGEVFRSSATENIVLHLLDLVQ